MAISSLQPSFQTTSTHQSKGPKTQAQEIGVNALSLQQSPLKALSESAKAGKLAPVNGLVYFGAQGPFFVMDGLPIRGGMGDITETCIPAINGLGHDIRPILPYDDKGSVNPRFGLKKTPIILEMTDPDNYVRQYQVYQSNTYQKGTVYYSLRLLNPPPKKEDKFTSLYMPDIIESLMYSQVSAALSKLLEPGAKPDAQGHIGKNKTVKVTQTTDFEEPLKVFDKPSDLSIFNDWSATPAYTWLHHFGDNYLESAHPYFFAHNLGYNKSAPVSLVRKAFGIEENKPVSNPALYDVQEEVTYYLPNDPNKRLELTAETKTSDILAFDNLAVKKSLVQYYNPLSEGIYGAITGSGKGVFIDPNYVNYVIDSLKGSNISSLLDAAKKATGPNSTEKKWVQDKTEYPLTAGLHYIYHGIPEVDFPIGANSSLTNDQTNFSINRGSKDFKDPVKFPYALDPSHKAPLNSKYQTLASDYQSLKTLMLPANKAKALKQLEVFKTTNKKAFQLETGLKADSSIPLISYIGRVDNYQKGTWLFVNSIPRILEQTNTPKEDGSIKKNVQFVFLGWPDPKDPQTPFIANKLKKYLELYPDNFFVYPGFNLQLARRAFAASDACVMPSIYEPFGIVQHQASAGASLIGPSAWVDGIRSTVVSTDKYYAPHEGIKPMAPEGREKDPPFAYFMDPDKFPGVTTPGGRQYVQQLKDDELGKNFGFHTQKADEEFTRVANKIVDLILNDPKTLREYQYNALKNVVDRHHWSAVAERFYKPIFDAKPASTVSTFA